MTVTGGGEEMGVTVERRGGGCDCGGRGGECDCGEERGWV